MKRITDEYIQIFLCHIEFNESKLIIERMRLEDATSLRQNLFYPGRSSNFFSTYGISKICCLVNKI